MTRCRRLATFSAIAAAILAAGVTDFLPHAWAASDEAGRGNSRDAGPVLRQGLLARLPSLRPAGRAGLDLLDQLVRHLAV